MNFGYKEAAALGLVLIIGAVLVTAIGTNLLPFQSFPERQVENFRTSVTYREALLNKGVDESSADQIISGHENRTENFGNQSIGRYLLWESPSESGTGAANVVAGVLWDYRGYDTLGEATIIFVAVASVAALFRAGKEEE